MKQREVPPPRSLPVAFDQCAQPIPGEIRRAGWVARPWPDFPEGEMVESLVTASLGHPLFTWSYNGPNLEYCGPVSAIPSELVAFLVRYSHAAVVVEAGPALYLYKQPRNQFSLVLGTEELVESVVSGTIEECRDRFVEWVDSARLTVRERQVLEEEVSRYFDLKDGKQPGLTTRSSS